MVAPDCYGCRASVPRYCASCVQQAITERRERLKEIEGDKYRLERGMRPSLAQRRRLLEQRQARRAHAASTARLSAELASVRAETDRQAIAVNEIRHAIRRHQLQRQQPPELTRSVPQASPCGTCGLRAAGSCMPYVPKAQGSLPPRPHALHAPCTVAPQARAAAAAATARGGGATRGARARSNPDPNPSPSPSPSQTRTQNRNRTRTRTRTRTVTVNLAEP